MAGWALLHTLGMRSALHLLTGPGLAGLCDHVREGSEFNGASISQGEYKMIEFAGLLNNGFDLIEMIFDMCEKFENICAVGINYALSAAQLKGLNKILVDRSTSSCHGYSNAGLPNSIGDYDEEFKIISKTKNIFDFARDGLWNYEDGCFGGTFPSRAIAVVSKVKRCPVCEFLELPKYLNMKLDYSREDIIFDYSVLAVVADLLKYNSYGSSSMEWRRLSALAHASLSVMA